MVGSRVIRAPPCICSLEQGSWPGDQAAESLDRIQSGGTLLLNETYHSSALQLFCSFRMYTI